MWLPLDGIQSSTHFSPGTEQSRGYTAVEQQYRCTNILNLSYFLWVWRKVWNYQDSNILYWLNHIHTTTSSLTQPDNHSLFQNITLSSQCQWINVTEFESLRFLLGRTGGGKKTHYQTQTGSIINSVVPAQSGVQFSELLPTLALLPPSVFHDCSFFSLPASCKKRRPFYFPCMLLQVE